MRIHIPTRKQRGATSEPARGVPLLRNDRGIVLILTLMVIMVLSVLATVFLFLSGTEINISRNSQVVTQAFYAAEAGIDTAFNQLHPPIPTIGIGLTPLGNNAQFQTGAPFESGPCDFPAGYNPANYDFNGYRVAATGTVQFPSTTVGLEVGACIGSPASLY